jgi:peroxiredoxin
MRRLAVLAFLVFLLPSVVTLRAAPNDTVSLQSPITGQTTQLEIGAPVLHIVFFALWCPPCLDELEALTQLQARWAERGYQLVLVAVQTRHTAERLTKFAEENELPGELLFDIDGAAEQRFAVAGLPTHLLLDGSGEIILRADAVGEVGPLLEDRLAFQPGRDR